MKSILKSCEPREDIIKGTFNPEIFTASLSEIISFYRGDSPGIHPVYTDAQVFFEEATYPTDGLRMVLSEVFGRLSGDNTVPAIHRLETAFGGGKTHTLIACAHLGFKGNALSSFAGDLLNGIALHEPETVSVVGVAGDEIPVHKPKGPKLAPYTLWGEIAYQIGGQDLYQAVEEEAESNAAPGKNYFDTVFGGKKVLLLLDELAQYAARLSAARTDGADQLAAFLMSLHGYARTHPGISILLTLASASDAFATQTHRLADLLSKVLGREVSADDALSIGQDAVGGVSSVVARDATPVVPVQAAEISRVLAKRLFTTIDTSAAEAVADAYQALYAKNVSSLPDEATRADYRGRMVDHYPFHPAFIDFLNNKLATSEGFQGTRGVLRVLALAVRNLWKKQIEVPMIHTCHLDMREPRIINEMVARTGAGDLLPILNADIGSADTVSQIEGGKSNAQLADERNPHPEGWPMHEYTWKTVFLHSLVGRNQGLESNLFGINEQDTLMEVSFPPLTPPQVSEALKEISRSAFYLRYNQGRYYASLDPSVNIALAKIRRNISPKDVEQVLDATARKVVSADTRTFHVVHDVAAPEHIPDKQGKPVLALVSLNAGQLNIEECVFNAGPNTPRMEQNNTLLLVPETVSTFLKEDDQGALFGDMASPAETAKKRLYDLARTVLAMKRLKRNPQNYAIHPRKLDEDEFKQRYSEREKALETSVTESYRSLWYPSANGKIVQKEIRTAGGEGGVSVLEQIRKTLLEESELLTSEHTTQSYLTNLKKNFFAQGDTVAISKLRENFNRLRSWPILDSPAVMDQLIRAGVTRGMWCVFRMGSDESAKPEIFYSREAGELPLDLDLEDCSLVRMEGARQRGWTKDATIPPQRIEGWVQQELSDKKVTRIQAIADSIKSKYGEVPEQSLNKAISQLVQGDRVMAYKGDPDQEKKPNLISGPSGMLYTPEFNDVLITPAKAAEKGWKTIKKAGLHLTGKDGAEKLFPLLRQIGSLYQRGGKSTIDLLDLVDMELPKGGRLRLTVTDTPPDSVKDLGELFEVLANLVQTGDTTEAYLDIKEKISDCPFIEKIEKK